MNKQLKAQFRRRGKSILAGLGVMLLMTTLYLIATIVTAEHAVAITLILTFGILAFLAHRYLMLPLQKSISRLDTAGSLAQLAPLNLATPLPWTAAAMSPQSAADIVTKLLTSDRQVILECGSGLSTIYTAAVCRLLGKGHVYSLENHPAWAERTRALLAANDLADFATIIEAGLKPVECDSEMFVWYDVESVKEQMPPLNSVHCLIVDGPPSNPGSLTRYPAVPLLAEYLASDCLIMLDDMHRPAEQQTATLWTQRYPVKHLPKMTNGQAVRHQYYQWER